MTLLNRILLPVLLILNSHLIANDTLVNEFGINGKTWKNLPKGTQSLIISSYLKGVSAGYTTSLIYTKELKKIKKIEFLQMMDSYTKIIPNKSLEDHHKNIATFYASKKNKEKDLFQAIWYSVKIEPYNDLKED